MASADFFSREGQFFLWEGAKVLKHTIFGLPGSPPPPGCLWICILSKWVCNKKNGVLLNSLRHVLTSPISNICVEIWECVYNFKSNYFFIFFLTDDETQVSAVWGVSTKQKNFWRKKKRETCFFWYKTKQIWTIWMKKMSFCLKKKKNWVFT